MGMLGHPKSQAEGVGTEEALIEDHCKSRVEIVSTVEALI